MKKLKQFMMLVVISTIAIFTMTMCGQSAEERANQNGKLENSRIHTIECGVGEYGRYDIIEVDGKEYLCNYNGGIILLGESKDTTNYKNE